MIKERDLFPLKKNTKLYPIWGMGFIKAWSITMHYGF